MSNAHDSPRDPPEVPNGSDLIDRHLAGILTPDEEAQLEHLIRTSPEWRTRYRDAERMAQLLHEGIGGTGAPRARRQAIRARIANTASTERRTTPRSRRQWLVAACALVALGATYLFLATDDDADLIRPVHADTPMPLVDLARSSDVLLLGMVVADGGPPRLRLESTIYGVAAERALELPAGLVAGQRVALFGRYLGDEAIEVVGGPRGVVPLDGMLRWEGRMRQPAVVRARVKSSEELRSLDSALADLTAFLASSASSQGVRGPEALQFSAEITARYLGRFAIERVQPLLMRLIRAREKHPEARNASAEALVEADPLRSCTQLLKAILMQPLEHLHAESEDGYVVMRCLQLMQRRGERVLAPDLKTFFERVHCPALKRAAHAAGLAVLGEGPRKPAADVTPTPLRLADGDKEAVVIPGCGGGADGVLVVFRHAGGVGQLSTLVQAAIHARRCVLILPQDAVDAHGWLQRAHKEAPGRMSAGPVTFLGVGTGRTRALQAATTRAPSRLMLVGGAGAATSQLTLDALERGGVAVQRETVSVLTDALADSALWKRVLATE